MQGWAITARVLSLRWKTGALLMDDLMFPLFLLLFFSFTATLQPISSPLAAACRFEQAFINSLLSESGANSSMFYWIGLVGLEENGEYHWLSDSHSSMPLTFSNWNKHQPGSHFFVNVLLNIPPAPPLELYFLLSCSLAQSVQVAVLLCLAVLLWVSGR